MWTTFVPNSDDLVRHIQAGFTDALTAHPMLMVGGLAGSLALVGIIWIVVLQTELEELRAEMANRGRPMRLRR